MGYLQLLRQRRILLLWVAQTLSVLGDRMYALAVMWLVWETTRSAALMGLVAVVESVPYVLVGVAGRRVLGRFATLGRLAVLDVARMAAVVALPAVWALHGRSLAALLVVAAVLGLLGALADPNMGALVPDLVPPEQVQQVIGLMDLMGRIARIAGPGAAGLLLAVLPEVHLYTIDAVTFGVSAAALAALARRATPAAAHTPTPQCGRRAGTRRLVRDHPVTACMIALHGAGQMLLGVALVLPALLVYRGGAGSQTYALAMTAAGIGAVTANAVAGNVRAAGAIPGAYCVAWIVQGVVMAATGAAWTAWGIVALSVAAGAVGPFTAVGLRTHLARFARDERLALMTVDQTVLRAAGTAGTLVLPMLAAAHPAEGFVAGGAATVAVAVSAWVAAWLLGSRDPLVEAVPAAPSPVGHARGPSPG